MVLEETLESPLDCKELKPVNPKGNQSWIFIGRIDAEAETPILWPPDVEKWLIWKDPDTGKDWRQEKKGMADDEFVGWHHQLDGHEFEQAPTVGDGEGSLACCSPSGLKELDTTERLNWKKKNLRHLKLMVLMLFYVWEDANSALTEIIHSICTLTRASILFFSIWIPLGCTMVGEGCSCSGWWLEGNNLFFSILNFPQGALSVSVVVADGFMAETSFIYRHCRQHSLST